jgi:hypothetical protein
LNRSQYVFVSPNEDQALQSVLLAETFIGAFAVFKGASRKSLVTPI